MKLINADDFVEWLLADAITDEQREFAEKVRYAAERMKPVDAVPVVRCKDCKHYQFADNRAFGFPVKRCEWTGFEDVDDEDFCSRGERKDGDHA